MIKDNCKNIPMHLLAHMIENNGQTALGQEYCMDALLERHNELAEREADKAFSAHMAGLFAQAEAMVAASKAVIAKAIQTAKQNSTRFAQFHNLKDHNNKFFGFLSSVRIANVRIGFGLYKKSQYNKFWIWSPQTPYSMASIHIAGRFQLIGKVY